MFDDKKSEHNVKTNRRQKQINDENRKGFSEKVIEEYQNPYHYGIMENPSGSGKIKGWCGDTMQIFLKTEKNRIIDAVFFTDGCMATMACGSMIIKLIENELVDKVTKITVEDLKIALDSLPAENEHCAELTIETLKLALNKCQKEW